MYLGTIYIPITASKLPPWLLCFSLAIWEHSHCKKGSILNILETIRPLHRPLDINTLPLNKKFSTMQQVVNYAMHKWDELCWPKGRMKHEKCNQPLYLEACIEEQKIHNRKSTGRKILEELIFFILVGECNFQTHDKYLQAVWALGNSSRFSHSAL